MARIEEKIAEIADPALRQIIAEEVAKLKKHTRFGLVFEEHQPEVVPVYGRRIKRQERVAKKVGTLTEIWRVLSVKDGHAHCELEKGGSTAAGTHETFPVDQLVAIRSMGEPIYPSLTPVDSVRNGDPSAPHHVLIEADNYHALQLLLFPYEGKVDCIYIDPPYNSGARDWKYNNDYVDGNDAWRHSKWLSMMHRRLQLAKRLLNPADSVLIVTIDEKEYLRLGLLLEQTFPESEIQMISSVIMPSGSSRAGRFSRADEYIYFVFIGAATVNHGSSDMLRDASESAALQVRWNGLIRNGEGSLRSRIPSLFYPIFIDAATGAFHSTGTPLPATAPRESVVAPKGTIPIFPVDGSGRELMWRLHPPTFVDYLAKGYAKLGRRDPKTGLRSPQYLQRGTVAKLEAGSIEVLGRDDEGALILQYKDGEKTYAPLTSWNRVSHSAAEHGSSILKALIPGRKFPYPKSLYAVEDCLRFIVKNKPAAIVLDFFAGSATTAHAVVRLNRQDGGHRQSISITNNEVAIDEQRTLVDQGLQPGQPDWEKWGICNHITYPRIAAAVNGKTPGGEPIKGDYKFTDEFPMAEGFSANLEYFRLDFLDPQEIQMGRQFSAILPILWMMAGSRGPRPDAPDAHAPWLLPDGCPFVVLMQETRFKEFVRHVESRSDLSHVFIVTNSLDSVHKLRHEWPELQVVQLYKDYLENFRINLSEKPAP